MSNENKTGALTSTQAAELATSNVMTQVVKLQNENRLHLPEDYSAQNALAAALNILEVKDKNNKSAMEVCSQSSIANALLTMVTNGLNPAKNQCYFIIYGNKLTCQISYFGRETIAKRVDPNVVEFMAQPIYESDQLEYEIRNGKKYITKHKQSFAGVNKAELIGAYCIVCREDGDNYAVMMTFDEIQSAWKMSKMNPVNENGEVKKGSTHDKFTAEMACKTVISRAAKHIINASNDMSVISFIQANDIDISQANTDYEISEKMGTGEQIDFEDESDMQELPQSQPTIDIPYTEESKFSQEEVPTEEPLAARNAPF